MNIRNIAIPLLVGAEVVSLFAGEIRINGASTTISKVINPHTAHNTSSERALEVLKNTNSDD